MTVILMLLHNSEHEGGVEVDEVNWYLSASDLLHLTMLIGGALMLAGFNFSITVVAALCLCNALLVQFQTTDTVILLIK